MTSASSLIDRAGLDRARVAKLARARPRGRRRRRAVPRIPPVGDARVRQRPAQAGDLRHLPGLRPARRQGRGGRLRARLRHVGGRDRARRRHGARRQGRLFGPRRRGSPRAPMSASTATTIRSRPRPSRTRSSCWRRSTPMPAPRTRACGRSSASVAASWQVVEILRADGDDLSRRAPAGAAQRLGRGRRRRPPGDRQPRLSAGARAMTALSGPTPGTARSTRRCARRWSIWTRSRPRPARWTWCSAPGWPGVMLHEAVGHGLEGDFNRKKTSAFAGLMGQRVAARGVTVVDDGTMAARRGSLTIDDEGTPTNRTVLIEDGILVGYMQDRQNARLMNMRPTGNGRRESYGHVPMPRMTNTYMLAGDRDPGEIIASVKNGPLRGQLRRRPGRHHLRQVRVPVHRGLPDRGRQGRRAGQGRHADRQRPDRPQPRQP